MRSWILGLCLTLAATPALADDTAKAKQLYDEGLAHFNVAEYTQAIDAWKQAYLLSKKPLLLFNIGQAYRLSGDCTQAMRFYDNYQDAEPNPKNADELAHAIEACKDAPSGPATRDAVATQPVGPSPVEAAPVQPAPAPVPPPPVTARPVAPAPVPAAITHPERTGGHATLGYATAIGGVALEGVAIYFALDGRAKAQRVQELGTWGQQGNDLQARGRLDNQLAWGLGIAGGAALVAGAVLIVTGHHGAEAHVAVVPTRGGAQLSWAHAF